MTMRQYVKNEFIGWRPLESVWLWFATAVILGLSIYWHDNAIGIISALTGVWCVILTGKGKSSSYIFGTVNVLLYAYIAFRARYYGEVMLNLLYYFPTNFIGLAAWIRHTNTETGEVAKRRLSLRGSILVYMLTAVGIAAYGWILKLLGGSLPFVDSMSTVVSIVAQILCIRRYMEQWVLWILVDIVTVVMWAVDYAAGGESIATLLMWIIYLTNAVIMFVRWYREARKNAV